MARIAGVATQKNAKGEITHITINVKKHKEAIPFLKELGLIEKTKFDEEFEQGISVEQCFDGVIEHIKRLPWKK